MTIDCQENQEHNYTTKKKNYLLNERLTNAKHAAIVSNQRRPTNGELVLNIELLFVVVVVSDIKFVVSDIRIVSFDMIKFLKQNN